MCRLYILYIIYTVFMYCIIYYIYYINCIYISYIYRVYIYIIYIQININCQRVCRLPIVLSPGPLRCVFWKKNWCSHGHRSWGGGPVVSCLRGGSPGWSWLPCHACLLPLIIIECSISTFLFPARPVQPVYKIDIKHDRKHKIGCKLPLL